MELKTIEASREFLDSSRVFIREYVHDKRREGMTAQEAKASAVAAFTDQASPFGTYGLDAESARENWSLAVHRAIDDAIEVPLSPASMESASRLATWEPGVAVKLANGEFWHFPILGPRRLGRSRLSGDVSARPRR